MTFPQRRTLLRSIGWGFVIVGGVAAFIFGYLGFEQYHAGDSRYGWLDIVYRTWQLFVLESGGVEPPVPLNLEVARILAPIVAAFAAVQLAIDVFRERWRLWRLRFRTGHVVIAGLGRRGCQLAAEALQRGLIVVVIDHEADAARRAELVALGAIFIPGDAAHIDVLRRARAAYASQVVAVCGSDGANVRVALTVFELERQSTGRTGICTTCHVQISDYSLGLVFREHLAFTTEDDSFDIVPFSSFENAARSALNEHPLDHQHIGPDDRRCVHLVILGFGQMGEALALQAARVGSYANVVPPRITVIDQDAATRSRQFDVRYPLFRECCRIDFVEAAAENPDTLSAIRAITDSTTAVATVALCFDDDSLNIRLALRLREWLGNANAPILVRIAEDAGLGMVVEGRSAERIYTFGSTTTSCSWDTLIGEPADRLARVIHERYVKQQRAEGRPEGPNTEPWGRLAPGLRESNRQQADHVPVKLRALGHDVRRMQDVAGLDLALTDDQVNLLARMEHARWNAERFVAGWSKGDKDVKRKRSPYLIPFDELPENVKGWDRDAVRNVPELLRVLSQSNTGS